MLKRIGFRIQIALEIRDEHSIEDDIYLIARGGRRGNTEKKYIDPERYGIMAEA